MVLSRYVIYIYIYTSCYEQIGYLPVGGLVAALARKLFTMSLSARQKQTAQAFVDGYNTWTIEGLLARRSKNCIHKIRPSSLQVPDKDNAQYEEQYSQLIPLLKNYKVRPSSFSLCFAHAATDDRNQDAQ